MLRVRLVPQVLQGPLVPRVQPVPQVPQVPLVPREREVQPVQLAPQVPQVLVLVIQGIVILSVVAFAKLRDILRTVA